jgi:hypothetical protein
MRHDILGFDRNGQIRLVAEVKNRRGVSSEWAKQLRRNILANGSSATGTFFLLLLPDQLYLWKPSAKPDFDSEPDWHSSVPDWVGKHGSSTSALEVSSFGWLSDLTRLTSPESLKGDADWEWATKSGLAESLRGGHVEIEPFL